MENFKKWFQISCNADAYFYSKRRARTLRQAFEKTFSKWNLIVNGYHCREGQNTCGLCNLYNLKDSACNGCPVKEITGKPYCHDTPYDVWPDNDSHYTRMLAIAELNFLRAVKKSVSWWRLLCLF